jgi:hypothetical protein
VQGAERRFCVINVHIEPGGISSPRISLFHLTATWRQARFEHLSVNIVPRDKEGMSVQVYYLPI